MKLQSRCSYKLGKEHEVSVSAVYTCVLDVEISGILLLNVKLNRKNDIPSTEFPGRPYRVRIFDKWCFYH